MSLEVCGFMMFRSLSIAKRSPVIAPCLLGLAFIFQSLAHAQAIIGGGVVSGSVSDASGAAIPAASVILSNKSQGILRSTETTDAGVFVVTALTPSDSYSVKVMKQGFAPWDANGFAVQLGQTLNFRITLEVSASTTRVEVTGGSLLVEEAKSGVSQVSSQQQIEELPINDRRTDTFVLMAPAVASDGTFGLVSFHSVSAGNSFLIDGIDTSDDAYYNENTGPTRISIQVSQESVQEFQVLSNGLLSLGNLDYAEEYVMKTKSTRITVVNFVRDSVVTLSLFHTVLLNELAIDGTTVSLACTPSGECVRVNDSDRFLLLGSDSPDITAIVNAGWSRLLYHERCFWRAELADTACSQPGKWSGSVNDHAASRDITVAGSGRPDRRCGTELLRRNLRALDTRFGAWTTFGQDEQTLYFPSAAPSRDDLKGRNSHGYRRSVITRTSLSLNRACFVDLNDDGTADMRDVQIVSAGWPDLISPTCQFNRAFLEERVPLGVFTVAIRG